MGQTSPDEKTRDLAAYLVLALEAICETVEVSVAAWEKRGYWIKADRFRMDWLWCETYAGQLRKALANQDWAAVAQVSVQIAGKLNHIKVSTNHRLGQPWVGAWKQYSETAR